MHCMEFHSVFVWLFLQGAGAAELTVALDADNPREALVQTDISQF